MRERNIDPFSNYPLLRAEFEWFWGAVCVILCVTVPLGLWKFVEIIIWIIQIIGR